MRHTAFAVIALFAAALVAAPAHAQKVRAKPAPAVEPAPCACPETPAPPLREGGLAECTDGVDNDGDGHLDCLDQDCEIYAACVLPRAAVVEPAPTGPVLPAGKTYTTMRALKQDLRAGVISGHDYFRWQMVIRAWREAEFDLAKADYRSGRITIHEYRARIHEIKLKYEG